MRAAAVRLALAAAAIFAVLASSLGVAHAIKITPGGTPWTGTATDAKIGYSTFGNYEVTCRASTMGGTTSSPSDDDMSALLTFDRCMLTGIVGLPATVLCLNPVTLFAASVDRRGGGSGWLTLDRGTNCQINVNSGFCTLTLSGGQIITSGWSYTPGASANLHMGAGPMNMTRTGSALCGPASGPGFWTGTYAISPVSTITIT